MAAEMQNSRVVPLAEAWGFPVRQLSLGHPDSCKQPWPSHSVTNFSLSFIGAVSGVNGHLFMSPQEKATQHIDKPLHQELPEPTWGHTSEEG